MPSKSKVYFFFDKVTVRLSDRRLLKKEIEALFKRERRPLANLKYVFCSDAALLRINKEYLNHDYLTDIISFDFSEKKAFVDGEVYISIDRVADNARLYHQVKMRELLRVIFHGALHLCGYADKTGPQQKLMRKMEEDCLERLDRRTRGVSRGTR